MDDADATRDGYFGGMEDGIGRGGQLGPDPIFRFPGFQMNHPDLGEVLQHGVLIPVKLTKRLVNLERNEWSVSSGIGGQFATEYAW
jgi:hypothetical protein